LRCLVFFLRTEESITHLQQAISISPQDPRPHELLGKAYARLNLYEQAQGELETAIHLDPQNPHLPCMLGPVYRKRGMMNQAQPQLERCAALNGTHSTPENSLP
jgi:cytochrome c-type biogenesis protein CcmH/NrfG